jgi:hypothetical protein
MQEVHATRVCTSRTAIYVLDSTSDMQPRCENKSSGHHIIAAVNQLCCKCPALALNTRNDENDTFALHADITGFCQLLYKSVHSTACATTHPQVVLNQHNNSICKDAA